MLLTKAKPAEESPLHEADLPVPAPGPGEMRVRMRVCGVCHTDLHTVEGDLPLPRLPLVPGHQIVGVVEALGPAVREFKEGDRVGIPWLYSTCGHCVYCTKRLENLCESARFTGYHVDGGYAEAVVVPAAFAYEIPKTFSDVEAAPLLCAGIIGYRALRRANLPPFGRLGIYGFGASAHLAAQIAIKEGAVVHVLTRSEEAQRLALLLGAASASGAYDRPPEPLDAAILFAPVGDLVPVALEALDRGGTLSVAGIHLSDIPVVNYERQLFQEKTLTSVTANTRADGEEMLAAASRLHVEVTTTPYPLDAADKALSDLANDRVRGAAVLVAGT